MRDGGSDPWPAPAAEELAPLWTALHARLCSSSSHPTDAYPTPSPPATGSPSSEPAVYL
ncbi:MAG: hypothetical protein QG608_1013 [Actinomycetota bacterium]|nr:hypothetical protein [Actinomycetota bacterium]